VGASIYGVVEKFRSLQVKFIKNTCSLVLADKSFTFIIALIYLPKKKAVDERQETLDKKRLNKSVL